MTCRIALGFSLLAAIVSVAGCNDDSERTFDAEVTIQPDVCELLTNTLALDDGETSTPLGVERCASYNVLHEGPGRDTSDTILLLLPTGFTGAFREPPPGSLAFRIFDPPYQQFPLSIEIEGGFVGTPVLFRDEPRVFASWIDHEGQYHALEGTLYVEGNVFDPQFPSEEDTGAVSQHVTTNGGRINAWLGGEPPFGDGTSPTTLHFADDPSVKLTGTAHVLGYQAPGETVSGGQTFTCDARAAVGICVEYTITDAAEFTNLRSQCAHTVRNDLSCPRSGAIGCRHVTPTAQADTFAYDYPDPAQFFASCSAEQGTAL